MIYVIIAVVVVVVLLIMLIRATSDESGENQQYAPSDTTIPAPSADTVRKPSPLAYAQVRGAKHVYGLPCPEDTNVTIEAFKDRVSFTANNIKYDLLYGKIIDVSIKMEHEVISKTTSSAGGAVAGAMLFGPLGAAIGGRAKTSNTYKFTDYLIFTYKDKSGEIAYMGYTAPSRKDVNHFIAEVKPKLPKVPANVEL